MSIEEYNLDQIKKCMESKCPIHDNKKTLEHTENELYEDLALNILLATFNKEDGTAINPDNGEIIKLSGNIIEKLEKLQNFNLSQGLHNIRLS